MTRTGGSRRERDRPSGSGKEQHGRSSDVCAIYWDSWEPGWHVEGENLICVVVVGQNLPMAHLVQSIETIGKVVLLTEITPLLLFSGGKLMLRKKLCRERLADDPIPRKTLHQRRVLSPGRVSHSIPLRGISQPEGEVYSKVVMQVLTYVL